LAAGSPVSDKRDLSNPAGEFPLRVLERRRNTEDDDENDDDPRYSGGKNQPETRRPQSGKGMIEALPLVPPL
jgi:hypothetical protein